MLLSNYITAAFGLDKKYPESRSPQGIRQDQDIILTSDLRTGG